MEVLQMPGWERYVWGLLDCSESSPVVDSVDVKLLTQGAVLGRSAVRARTSVSSLDDS